MIVFTQNGEERMRPAKLSDHMPGPYKNEQEGNSITNH
jgi:hypothetical protein